MRRVIPFPWVSVALLLIWLALWDPATPFDVLIGLTLAIALPFTLRLLDENPSTAKRPGTALRLFFTVLYDIAMSNLAVIRILLTLRDQVIPTGFVNIPLKLRDRYGLAVLAMIITSTPGTFWAAYNRRTNVLTIHVYDLHDEDEVRNTIISRYEVPLREIFE